MRTLQGTEKQVVWATKIRANLMKGFALIEREVKGGNKKFVEIIQRNLDNEAADFFISIKDQEFSIVAFCKACLYDAYYDDEIDDEGIDEYIEVLESVFDNAYVMLRNSGKTLDFQK